MILKQKIQKIRKQIKLKQPQVIREQEQVLPLKQLQQRQQRQLQQLQQVQLMGKRNLHRVAYH